MKKKAAVAAIVSLVLVAGLFVACPPKTPPPPGPDTAPPSSAAVVAKTWVEQVAVVKEHVDEAVACVERNDKAAALTALSDAYNIGYESPARNLEVASMRYLPEEELGGKMRNVKIVREESFSDIRGAVRAGAPVSKVRELADALIGKISDDAKKLDEMKVAPP